MENVCHTLCGLALARAGGDRLGPLATPTVVIAANLPDWDIVAALWGGKPAYMCHHRGITHAVVGLLVESVVLALLVRGVAAWRERRAEEGAERASLLGLWGAAALGLASHLALDGLNTYGIRPWLPFSPAWIYSDIAFILDPWLWLLFGACSLLPGPRTPWGNVGWTSSVLFGAMFVWAHPRSSWGVALPWSLIAATLLAVRWRFPRLEGQRSVALAGLGVVVIYLGGLCLLSRAADAKARASVGQPVVASTCHPSPGVPWRFTAVVDAGETLHVVHVNLLSGKSEEWRQLPTQRDHAVLNMKALRETPEFEAWQVFARHPWVGVDGNQVILGDGRYSQVVEDTWCNFLVALPPAAVPESEPRVGQAPR